MTIDRFQHKSEAAFAAFLDRHGIRWLYEPHEFDLRVNGNGHHGVNGGGRMMAGFRPDFYLPDEGVYVELTTMSQKNVTRKHRKLRLMSEVHPDIRVIMLYRKDLSKLGGDRELEVLEIVLD